MMLKISDVKKLGSFFTAIDTVFADFIVNEAMLPDLGELFLAAALASKSVRDGHSCCALKHYAGHTLKAVADSQVTDEEETFSLECPPFDEWIEILTSPSASRILSVAPAIRRTVMILDENHHLFLYRYYYYERELAAAVNRLRSLDVPPCSFPTGTLGGMTEHFRRSSASQEIDWQQAAVWMALNSGFSVISGGPGTGKTTVVASIIALELMRNHTVDIALSAPTGKAQARLKESLVAEAQMLSCGDDIKTHIAGLKCATIHSLLGAISDSSKFRHHSENPLSADLVVIDEASMVPLSLMAKLTAALKPGARLILLGDRDQLASVEAGAVLADICDCGNSNAFSPALAESFMAQTGWMPGPLPDGQPLSGHIAELVKNHRFRDDSGIGKVSSRIRMLNSGGTNPEDVAKDILSMDTSEFKTLRLPRYSEIEPSLAEIVRKPEIRVSGTAWAFSDITKLSRENSTDVLDTAYRIICEFKILCGIRKGFFGCENINRTMRRILGIDAEIYPPGLPVMILKNDRMRNLYNGDIGIVWELHADGMPARRKVYFPNPDGTTEGGGKFISFYPSELPEHEEVFAMTIHKSQGSGFQKVLMLLPERWNEVVTRELVYTGITRARESVDLWCDGKILEKALSQRTLRQSSLEFKIRQQAKT